MVVFPNCKINIGLNILGKRPDGFHDLETVFFPVPLKDALEIIPSKEKATDVVFSQSGIMVDGHTDDNLCVKAYHLLKKVFPALPPVQIHLHKAIPLGAGLGGGSADAAFALQLLNTRFDLQLTEGQLMNYSLALGSDCPFFIINKPCFAAGRGERLTQVQVSLSGYHLVLINPAIHINTGWAFAQLQHEPIGNRVSKELIHWSKQPVQQWRNTISNDFEQPVFAAHPVLPGIKEMLYSKGAIYAALTGSGSTIFGLFEKGPITLPPSPAEWMVIQITL